ncbi:DUF4382 domain-containing protein [Halonotius terrestris]|uniref:DUF4382 domain-containing protein n=2 Tax=Halonotius terrestris TaxID=2487750 RepID=A0A8J8P8Y6_9EURY|nr:DUF4382 domain-containing protein [Halonotius terrestris]
MIGLAGCAGSSDETSSEDGSDDTAFGTLSTSVTDQPNAIDDFESLTVTLAGIWIKPAGGDGGSEEMDDEEMNDSDGSMNESEMNGSDDEMNESDEEMDEEEMEDEEMDEEGDDAGRRYIEFEEPQEADLVQLQGSSTKLIDETEVEAGDYEFLQLDVSGTEGVLTDGSDANVTTPGEAPLKFNKSFEVRAEETTRFIADFAPNRTGNGRYIIRPVATSTTVLYGDEEYQGGDASMDGGNETMDGGNETMDDGSSGGNETMSGNQTGNASS